MRRLPKKGEITGGHYTPPENGVEPQVRSRREHTREYVVRELPGDSSFNAKIDAFYAEQGGALSLEALREQARRGCEGSIGRLQAALQRLRAKEAEFASADRLREYGDIILANIAAIKPGDAWLDCTRGVRSTPRRIPYQNNNRKVVDADNFYAHQNKHGEAVWMNDSTRCSPNESINKAEQGGLALASPVGAGTDKGETLRIKLDPQKSPAAQAEFYYEQYGKAKKGLADIQTEIQAGERELQAIEQKLDALLTEDNPLVLAKLLKTGGAKTTPATAQDKKRPGLSFRRGDWLIMVGRDAAENDALLRRHVKGGDLWLHARDFPGSYVFIKQRSGKTFPLDIMLDAGNLAIFYSKGRNNAEGDLFYTPVKYLRRAKNGPKGLVIPTQEKNLHVKLDQGRLRELESCRIEK